MVSTEDSMTDPTKIILKDLGEAAIVVSNSEFYPGSIEWRSTTWLAENTIAQLAKIDAMSDKSIELQFAPAWDAQIVVNGIAWKAVRFKVREFLGDEGGYSIWVEGRRASEAYDSVGLTEKSREKLRAMFGPQLIEHYTKHRAYMRGFYRSQYLERRKKELTDKIAEIQVQADKLKEIV